MPHVDIKELWQHDGTHGLNVSQYMVDLADKLKMPVIRTEMRNRLADVMVIQRDKEDTKSLKTFEVNDQVLFRTPGLVNKLDTAWQGPYSVVKRIGKLNYEIQWTKDGKKHKRVVHLNHLKPYNEQFLVVNRVMVTTDDADECSALNSVTAPTLTDSQKQELDSTLKEFNDIFSVLLILLHSAFKLSLRLPLISNLTKFLWAYSSNSRNLKQSRCVHF